MNLNNEYYNYLLKQFLDAKGLRMDDMNSHYFISSFTDWIKENQKIGEEYLQFLFQICGKNVIDREDTFEVGKGKLDSIVKNLKTIIISPYGEEFTDVDRERIICGRLGINGCLPFCYKESKNSIEKTRKSYSTNTFMTQNPYSVDDIFNWECLQNGSSNSIIVGAYGDIKDKNVNQKIKMLEEFRKKLICNVNYEYITLNNNYFCIVNGSKKKKELVKKYY